MQPRVIQRVLGYLLCLFSLTLLPPIVVALIYRDGALWPFVVALAVTVTTGGVMWYAARNERAQLRLRDSFVVVVSFWAVLGAFGALPFYLYAPLNLSVAAAIFESMSGLTTTGATLIVGLDQLPHSILFYRQEMQWLGGMGIIVLAVAILPALGIGGMQLYRAESSGPTKSKLTPRIAETAKALWYIYLGLTVTCALAYWLAGMSVFDAIGHSFSTVAIGGFSTHDASIGYFHSRTIEMIAVVFMLISGVNFALHFLTLRSRKLSHYYADAEFRFYVLILMMVTAIAGTYLAFTQTTSISDSFLDGLFHVVSIGTTTGFTTQEYHRWPGFLPVLLLFASFAGGCAGSTGGGMKVIRILLLFKQGQRELMRMLHPNAVLVVKVGDNTVDERTRDVVWGFFATYIAVMAVMMLLLMAAGLDQESAFSAVVACLNNLGPGLGEVGANYAGLGDFSWSVLSMAMLFGRLEIFTLLVIFTPAFWRH
ncbi:MAG: TrkH family potassium uptake protein [Gammaproteobacteria bacterium]|nr:TrkH family potassium uptake protein [Gammaproteobacteria bacterium]